MFSSGLIWSESHLQEQKEAVTEQSFKKKNPKYNNSPFVAPDS